MKDCKNTTEGVIKHMLGGIYRAYKSIVQYYMACKVNWRLIL